MRRITVQVRITADTQEESDLARAFLEDALPGLGLQKGRAGGNPKYAENPKVLAYGQLVFCPTTPKAAT